MVLLRSLLFVWAVSRIKVSESVKLKIVSADTNGVSVGVLQAKGVTR